VLNDAAERVVASERRTSEIGRMLRLEKAKKAFMQKSMAALLARVEVVMVKLKAELGHWYNTITDGLYFSDYLGTLFHITSHFHVHSSLC
jgi:hypothetical protein